MKSRMLLGYLTGRDRHGLRRLDIFTVTLISSLYNLTAVMVSHSVFTLLCVSCVALVALVRADDCSSYVDRYGRYHESQKCSFFHFCCGECSLRQCCSSRDDRFTEEEQDRCPNRPSLGKGSTWVVILGSVLGVLLPLVFCVGLVICCVAPCCLLYKKCRKSNRRQAVTTTTIVHPPAQPVGPSGYQQDYPSQPTYPIQPTYPGYQPVPGFGTPEASAPPPSYMETISPSRIPVAFEEGHPMYPLQPPQSDERDQPPFNPSYVNKP